MSSIREIAYKLECGSVTSVQLIEQALERIDAHRRGGGSAYIDINADAALAHARASDKLRKEGRVPSLLAGQPVSIKDNIDVQGEVTAAGSRSRSGQPPAREDAAVVMRLRQAGAILLGRTNMSEFAYSGLGLNPHFGTPENPFDATRITGGSSSGAAISVALDMASAALGTDTGGSVRIPSSFCGLTGLKPTARRVSTMGILPLSGTLDSVGTLARTVDCCMIVDAIIADTTMNVKPVRLRELRFGFTMDLVGAGLDGVVERSFERVLKTLQEAGAGVEKFDFPELLELPQLNSGGGFAAAEAWAYHRKDFERNAEQYDPRVAARIRQGSRQEAADYIDLLTARRRIIEAAHHRLSRFDAWLMPTVAVLPPRLSDLQDEDSFFTINAKVLRNPSVVNFIDGCALSLPVSSESVPGVGISLCRLAGDDSKILAIGRAMEALIHSV